MQAGDGVEALEGERPQTLALAGLARLALDAKHRNRTERRGQRDSRTKGRRRNIGIVNHFDVHVQALVEQDDDGFDRIVSANTKVPSKIAALFQSLPG